MTTSEFDVQFDIYYNNVTSNQAPGLNAYEKSVFLTRAQLQLVQEYFNPRIDGTEGGFDGSPKRQTDFSSITITESLSDLGSPSNYVRIHPNSFIFKISQGGSGTHYSPLAILNESVTVVKVVDGVNHYDNLTVKPLSFTEYQRVMLQPYKYPPKGMAWRIMNNGEYAEVISLTLIGNTVTSVTYNVRYVRKPGPIILEPRLDELMVSIDGIGYGDGANHDDPSYTTLRECELPDEMHQDILERAVTLAKMAWQGTTMTQTALAVQAGKN